MPGLVYLLHDCRLLRYTLFGRLGYISICNGFQGSDHAEFNLNVRMNFLSPIQVADKIKNIIRGNVLFRCYNIVYNYYTNIIVIHIIDI